MDQLKCGDIISFDNGLVKVKHATIIKVSEKSAFKEANGESIRYVARTEAGYTHLCSPSEILAVEKVV